MISPKGTPFQTPEVKEKTAILLVNLGTPTSLTLTGVCKFLRAFLWDKRVVKLPSFVWWIILHIWVLPLRTRKVLKLYQNIWTTEGSPLQVFTERLSNLFEIKLRNKWQWGNELQVFYSMTYGVPDIPSRLKCIVEQNVKRLIIIPLFPQFSSTTTAAVFDKIANYFRNSSYIPTLHFMNEYASIESYQLALEQSVRDHWQHYEKGERFLFSFHSIPLSCEKAGDPYPKQCKSLALSIASRLNLPKESWALSFQSRFGYSGWLEPSTDDILRLWASQGIKSVTVLSPSFSVDCLETLEELNIRVRQQFQKAGGESFHYIPALNDSQRHIDVLLSLCNPYFENNFEKK